MRVFVTGATGWVGSAVVGDLIAAGHSVLGLARSDAGAATLAATGAEVLRGTIEELDTLRRGAEGADGVIHTAFNHDWSRFAASCEEDRRAIEALGEVLVGSERPLLVTSGLMLLASGRTATEADAPAPVSPAYPRASEQTAIAMTERGVRAATVRLPPSVHGTGDHGFVPILIGIAREKGVSAYVGDGRNRWPAVHRFDAARLYRLALEHGAKDGPYHAVAEEGVAFKALAEAIAHGLDVPAVSLDAEAAAAHFGWFAMFAGADVPASSARTREMLGWVPERAGLLEDVAGAGYFGG